MDTTQFGESQYLNTEIIKASTSKKVVVVGDAEIEDGKFGPKLTLPIEIDGKRKKWGLNKDMVKSMQSAYGKDSRIWINQNVEFKVINVAGKEQIVCLPQTVKTETIQ